MPVFSISEAPPKSSQSQHPEHPNHHCNLKMKKGEKITVLGEGKYAGRTGWIDLDGPPLEKQVYVLLKMVGNNVEAKRLYKTSIKYRKTSTCYEEALLDQHPDIEAKMNALADMLAKCEMCNTARKFGEIFN